MLLNASSYELDQFLLIFVHYRIHYETILELFEYVYLVMNHPISPELQFLTSREPQFEQSALYSNGSVEYLTQPTAR